MNSKIKILLAEDNINDVHLLQKELKRENIDFEMTIVANETDFRKNIMGWHPDIILSDFSMPVFDGMTALMIKNELSPLTPFIIVTGSLNEDTAVDCIKSGADDYVIKEHINRIGPSIRSSLRKFQLNLEKEKAQKALIQSENKYRNLVENLAVGVYQISPDGKILQINPAFEKIMGVTDENRSLFLPGFLETQSAWDFYPDKSLRTDFIQTIIEQGEVRDKELQIYDLNHNLIWVSVSSKAKFDDDGKLLWIDGVMEDISQRKDSERELVEAKEKAEEMNSLKSIFLTNMSHELRTPLVAILGFAEMLNKNLADEPNKRMAEMILRGGRRLTSTLDLILDLSRIESGNVDADVYPQEISSIVKSAYNLYKIQTDKKNLDFKLELQDNLVAVINAGMFEKILDNLIQNAITFTKSGGISISTGKEKIDSQDHAFVRIVDTGIGIDENNFDFIFEPFRQVSEGYGRKYEGTGLGLSITKKYVEMMSGKLRVVSQLGKGSEFTVYLPCGENVAAVRSKANIPDSAAQGAHENRKRGLKILLVEDDELNAEITGHVLKAICEYDWVESGEEAINKCMENKYSLILIDIGLKGIDGIGATKEIRKIPAYYHIPIIALTAYAMVGDRERFLSNGCDDYISKPFEINNFIATVKNYLY